MKRLIASNHTGRGVRGSSRERPLMGQPACKPGSVGCEASGAPHVTAIPLRRRSPGVWCNLPERQDPDMIPGSPRAAPIRSCSRWGLPCRLRCRRRGALLPHRFTLAPVEPEAVWFSVALSLGLPPPDVIRHRLPVEPGLSSPAAFRRLAERPSGRLTTKGWGYL
jgi:hypothetical protein